MERRSARGRTSSVSEAAVPVTEVPEVGGEEVVSNRRQLPARQRKKNRFYFDDETMVTDHYQKRGQGRQSGGKKIKTEPVDDMEGELITGDIPGYGMGGEVEVPTAVVEEVVTSASPRRPGRPSIKSKVEQKGVQREVAVTKGQKGKSSMEAVTKRGRSDSRRSMDEPEARTGKSQEVRGRVASRDERSSESALNKQVIKIKREPGTSGVMDVVEQRYLEKREKDRLAKQRERERQRERDRLIREREREYNSVMPLKSRGRREPSPATDFATAMIPTSLEDMRSSIDKKAAQDISLRLRNLLKLPKAHKWVCYEWFYSNIDKVLFEGENDFQTCLRESFPLLKARKLTRVEWCKIRRIMGKPRRCSQAFFDEEREELQRRRQKIRMIQQRKITDFNYKELPDEIPLQLTIGTKVTARLRRPQDGLFTGTIEGVDTSNNTYRITFDRAGLGTHSIPDYEVLSNDPVETVSTSSFALKIPRRSFGFGTAAFKFQNPGLIGEDGIYRFPTSPFPEGGMLGGFPIRLLDMIVRLSKLLKAKREKILQLKELNVEAEKMLSYGKPFNTDYRLRYARCVLDLDSMNKEMAMYVEGIQTYCLEQIAPDHGANQMIVPEQVQEQCKQEAALIVDTYNSKNNRRAVQDSKAIGLISNLTSLMLQVKTLSSGERNLYELKSIKETIKDAKASLEGKNLQLFQNRVEIPMNRIQAGLCIYTKSF